VTATVVDIHSRRERARSALEAANVVRLAGAQLRRELAAGEVSLAEALVDPRSRSMEIRRLLMAVPGVGEYAAQRLCKRLGISTQRRVPDLLAVQRSRIVRELPRVAPRITACGGRVA
jgi:hypothetical protein